MPCEFARLAKRLDFDWTRIRTPRPLYVGITGRPTPAPRYPLVATNWTRKLSIVSFNSKRHFPLMFSLFSFAPCVFWSVIHTWAEYWSDWAPESTEIGAISWRGENDATLAQRRWCFLRMCHDVSIMMVYRILVPANSAKRKAHIKTRIASRQKLFQRIFYNIGSAQKTTGWGCSGILQKMDPFRKQNSVSASFSGSES